MEIQPDYKELLELLNAHNVDFVIVGGATAHHFTGGEHAEQNFVGWRLAPPFFPGVYPALDGSEIRRRLTN